MHGTFLRSMFAPPVTQLEEADDSAYCGRGHYGGRGRGVPKPTHHSRQLDGMDVLYMDVWKYMVNR